MQTAVSLSNLSCYIKPVKTRHRLIGSLVISSATLGHLNADSFSEKASWNYDTPVYQVLKELGQPMPKHYIGKRSEKVVKRGEAIIKYAYMEGPEGNKGKIQSHYFTCINCHNIRREDPDLRVSDPDARLYYAIQNDLPFLPGTTLYGVVNRERWYNGDYGKRYGDLVYEANRDLVKAIQLCATECSMGRKLEDSELESVLAYFWSIDLKLGNLNLSDSDWQKLRDASLHPEDRPELIPWLKAFYLKAAPANFAKPPAGRALTYEHKGNIGTGKAIYVRSCLNCHKSRRTTSFVLGNSKSTYQLLYNHTHFDSVFSVYNAIRNGIKTSPGKGYMPNYPLERMSDRQMEDLMAFFNHQATHKPLSLGPPN